MIKFLLRIFFISIAVIIFIFYAKDYHPFDKNDYQRIIDNNQITIAVRFGPTSYYQIKDKEIGYTFEIMELYAKYLNVKLNIVTIDDLDEAVEMLNNRDIDILADICYGYAITTHKSQGSNYKVVFVDMENIITCNSI